MPVCCALSHLISEMFAAPGARAERAKCEFAELASFDNKEWTRWRGACSNVEKSGQRTNAQSKPFDNRSLRIFLEKRVSSQFNRQRRDKVK